MVNKKLNHNFVQHHQLVAPRFSYKNSIAGLFPAPETCQT